jgi:stage V sporulation protein D (sporulation-specific penicillin-binding protein)
MNTISSKKRIRNAFFVFLLILIFLTIRLGWIQFYDGESLQSLAYQQQTLDRSINPNRGTIYDRNGDVLATSATVETITINPTNISSENKEKVAKAFSDIFELDYNTVFKKVKKRSSIETIAKKVEKSKADELRVWMEDNDIYSGINIDEDTKRYYPYQTLCSQVIGFTGSDNQGLNGIEAKYDSVLSGEKGKIERASDATGSTLDGTVEEYISAIDGDSLELTIDATIQSIVEKYLEEACIDNVCTDGGNVIIMNPNNGDILAMATYPGYDLNSPYTINNNDLSNIWDTLSSSDKSNALEQMWRNKAISDTYEPGSTFKLITASASLEEGLVTDIEAENFSCTGGIDVAGTRIKCWRYYRPHGSESLRTALMNSCNPIFIGLGQKIGVAKYFEYLKKFGLLSKTGDD